MHKYLLLAVFGLLFSGCETSTDNNQNVDEVTNTPVGTTNFTSIVDFNAAASPYNTIDFDDQLTGEILLGDEYPNVEISARSIFVVNPVDLAPGLVVGQDNVNSAPNGISASLLYASSGTIVFDDLDDNFLFRFMTDTTGAGIWIGNVGASDNDTVTRTKVTFFDSSGNVISEFNLTQASDGLIGNGATNRIFRGVRSNTSIASMSVQNAASDNDGIFLDDLVIERAR